MPDAPPEGHRPSGLTAARALRDRRLARAILLVLLALLVGAYLITGPLSGGSFTYEGDEAPAFEISWSELEQGEPEGGELLRLLEGDPERPRQQLTVSPLVAPAAQGEGEERPALASLALASAAYRRQIAERYPGARIVLEGLGRLEIRDGREVYQLAFHAPEDESVVLGKLLLIPEDPDGPLSDPPRAVAIEIVQRSDDEAVIERVERAPATFFFNWPSQQLLEDEAAVQTERGLEEPLRSFGFR